MKKKLLTMALAVSMILTVPLTSAFAVSDKGGFTVNQATTGTTEIVYGGQSWYVIGYNGIGVASESGSMTLLAKDNLKTGVSFHATNNAYAGSNLKTEIDKLAGLSSAGSGGLFTPAEQNTTKKVTLTGGSANNAQGGMCGPNVENAILWPLDVAEVSSVNSELRRTSNHIGYWLRSPGENLDLASLVDSYGKVIPEGYDVSSGGGGVRPAFKLNLSSVLFASDASGAGAKSGTAGDTLSAMKMPTNVQKLTIVDSGISAGTVTATGANTYNGTTIKVSTTGATAGKSLSAMITDSTGSTVKYYGKIADIKASGNVTDADLILPVTLDTNNTLKIFTEEINGDNLTDYASAPVAVTVLDNTAPTLTLGAANRTSETAATVKFTSNEAGNYYYHIGTAVTDTATGGTACDTSEQTITLSSLTAGAKDIYIRVKDAAENVSDDSFKITIPAYVASGSSTGGGGSSYNYYTITVTQAEGGAISPTTVSVRESLDKTFCLTPSTGYVIKDVLVDGKSVGVVKQYTFKDVNNSHKITAVFEKSKYENPNTGAWNNPFEDVKESDWFYEKAALVHKLGLMQGTSATTFEPNIPTTRGMILTVLYNMADKPEVEASGTPWCAVTRAWALKNEISDGTNVESKITREQLVTMLWRNAGSPVVTNDRGLSTFSDAGTISNYAKQAFAWAYQQGIIQGNGNGTLDPHGNATRAEAATMITNYLNAMEK